MRKDTIYQSDPEHQTPASRSNKVYASPLWRKAYSILEKILKNIQMNMKIFHILGKKTCHCGNAILPKYICKVSVIPTEWVSHRIFHGTRHINSKTDMEEQEVKKSNEIPVKMNKIRWFALPDIKTNIKLWKLCDTGLDEQTSGIE